MKKENKRLAQQRKAEERQKQEKKQKVLRLLAYWGPVVLAVVAIVIVVVAIVTSGQKNDGDLEAGEGSEVEIAIDSEDADTELELDMDTEEDDSELELDMDTESGQGTLNTEAGLEAKDGDKVNIDFVGKVDGKEFDGGSTGGAGYDLVLGSHSFIDGFESGVVGHKVGETFDLNLKFPADYHSADLAGKDVVFTTTLNGIYGSGAE